VLQRVAVSAICGYSYTYICGYAYTYISKRKRKVKEQERERKRACDGDKMSVSEKMCVSEGENNSEFGLSSDLWLAGEQASVCKETKRERGRERERERERKREREREREREKRNQRVCA